MLGAEEAARARGWGGHGSFHDLEAKPLYGHPLTTHVVAALFHRAQPAMLPVIRPALLWYACASAAGLLPAVVKDNPQNGQSSEAAYSGVRARWPKCSLESR
jgi:hypothetical protein